MKSYSTKYTVNYWKNWSTPQASQWQTYSNFYCTLTCLSLFQCQIYCLFVHDNIWFNSLHDLTFRSISRNFTSLRLVWMLPPNQMFTKCIPILTTDWLWKGIYKFYSKNGTGITKQSWAYHSTPIGYSEYVARCIDNVVGTYIIGALSTAS